MAWGKLISLVFYFLISVMKIIITPWQGCYVNLNKGVYKRAQELKIARCKLPKKVIKKKMIVLF